MMRSRRHLVVAACAIVSLSACDREGGPSPQGGPAPPATSGAATAAAATTRAVITMDAAHDVMTTKDAPAYAIAPSAELVIEASDFRFPVRDAGGTGAPDSVHVVHGSSGYYRASFSGKRIVLNAGSLDSMKGRGAFPGFEAGEPYIVAVGAEAPSADGAMKFAPAWTAKVVVR